MDSAGVVRYNSKTGITKKSIRKDPKTEKANVKDEIFNPINITQL